MRRYLMMQMVKMYNGEEGIMHRDCTELTKSSSFVTLCMLAKHERQPTEGGPDSVVASAVNMPSFRIE